MTKLSKFGEAFLLLALRIGKHIEGYVDFYYGPEKLRQIVECESITAPNTLLNDSNDLLKQLVSQGFDKERIRYIEKLLIAMRTSIETLCGVEIPFKEKFLRLYDVDLQPVNESKLKNLKEDFNEAYKGTGTLVERMKVLREKRKVPEDKVYQLFKEALNITRVKTNELFGDILPEKERILIELVDDKNGDKAKWAYYEWYLGNFQSRLEINPTYNMYWSTFLSSATHEGYPGHHTEFAVKEKNLYRELSQFEHSILLLKSPTLLLCEGIADLAVNVLFSYREQAELSLEFCSNGTKDDSVENLTMQNRVKTKRSLLWYNLAYHALFDEWSEANLIQYGTNYEIFSLKDIKNIIKLILDPAHSTTTFLYNLGSKLIINRFGEFPSVKNFRNLLLNPFLPSDLV
ncbi:MAG: hypothetical protein ACTSQU_09075 [Promethearchaeota archaeon]